MKLELRAAGRRGSLLGAATPLTHCQVQVVSLSQSSQPVQAATLVVALQTLDEAWG